MQLTAGMLTEESVTLDLMATRESDAIREVAALLEHHPDVKDFSRLVEEVVEREQVACTASASGVAFPHARTDAVDRIVVAIGRSQEGIAFNGGQKVHFIVVIGTPKANVREYLLLVGKLARLFKTSHTRQQLATATTTAEFLAPLQDLGSM